MSNSRRPGKLFIISAPSGGGKTTLCKNALEKLSDIVRSVSYTTRNIRAGEVDGGDYHFITEADFKRMIKENRFAEWAIVHGYYYGTDRLFIEQKIKAGIDVILNIDVQGARQLVEKYPEVVTIFIHTPSFEELKRRLRQRKSETEVSMEKRLKDAQEELKASASYRFHIVNDEFEKAAQELIEVIQAQRRKK